MLKYACLLFILGAVCAKNEKYDGHSLYLVEAFTEEANKVIRDFEDIGVDVWSHGRTDVPATMLVAPELKKHVERTLNNAGLKFEIQVENILDSIKMEEQLFKLKSNGRAVSNRTLSYDRIYTFEEVNAYMDEVASRFPSLVTIATAGTTHEGRAIRYLRISTTNFQEVGKPIVYMESMIHAREWVTITSTLYAIQKLVVENAEPELLNTIDWIILPILNPDGYVYTHTTERFWRKNRARGQMIGDFCVGVDLNRNFDADWGVASSNVPCTDTFHGHGPFSEAETSAVRDILALYRNRVSLFLDIHSFGSMILYPWGATGLLPPSGLLLHLVGVQMAAAIDANKVPAHPNYIVGNSAQVLGRASGGADDYGIVAGIDLSYCFEMPAFNNLWTMNGFLVDVTLIEQFGRETWEGIKVGARYVRDNRRRDAKA